MSFNIDVNRIADGFLANWEASTATTSEWMSRAVVILKSGAETAISYLQDKRIAAVSLIAVNLILIEMIEIFSYFCDKYFPNHSTIMDITFGISLISAGITAFARYTNLPFSTLTIAGISIGTLLIRSSLSK